MAEEGSSMISGSRDEYLKDLQENLASGLVVGEKAEVPTGGQRVPESMQGEEPAAVEVRAAPSGERADLEAEHAAYGALKKGCNEMMPHLDKIMKWKAKLEGMDESERSGEEGEKLNKNVSIRTKKLGKQVSAFEETWKALDGWREQRPRCCDAELADLFVTLSEGARSGEAQKDALAYQHFCEDATKFTRAIFRTQKEVMEHIKKTR